MERPLSPREAYIVMLRSYPDVLNVEQVSEILGICTKTVYKLLGQGQITSIRVGRTYRVPKAHLLTYLLHPGNVQNS